MEFVWITVFIALIYAAPMLAVLARARRSASREARSRDLDRHGAGDWVVRRAVGCASRFLGRVAVTFASPTQARVESGLVTKSSVWGLAM